jgi:hypothetical protein
LKAKGYYFTPHPHNVKGLTSYYKYCKKKMKNKRPFYFTRTKETRHGTKTTIKGIQRVKPYWPIAEAIKRMARHKHGGNLLGSTQCVTNPKRRRCYIG